MTYVSHYFYVLYDRHCAVWNIKYEVRKNIILRTVYFILNLKYHVLKIYSNTYNHFSHLINCDSHIFLNDNHILIFRLLFLLFWVGLSSHLQYPPNLMDPLYLNELSISYIYLFLSILYPLFIFVYIYFNILTASIIPP